ncbi:hypothetical protein JOB18_025763 [Solea senegalensis]|uniref:Uncharacterized protein n=1 Tax=Solea senegalensis TaxID=28829 RepID=A0AAV6S124_SOLSE|nr:hypothetical protein JOB18_025763 [Solea senegalensis]
MISITDIADLCRKGSVSGEPRRDRVWKRLKEEKAVEEVEGGEEGGALLLETNTHSDTWLTVGDGGEIQTNSHREKEAISHL